MGLPPGRQWMSTVAGSLSSIFPGLAAVGAGDPAFLEQLPALGALGFELCLTIWADDEVLLNRFPALRAFRPAGEELPYRVGDVHRKIEPRLAATAIVLPTYCRAAVLAKRVPAQTATTDCIAVRVEKTIHYQYSFF